MPVTMFQRHAEAILSEVGWPVHEHAQVMQKITFVDITPSAQWFLADSEQEFWDWGKDFPTLAPPWPLYWMEFVSPAHINSEGRMIPVPRINGKLPSLGMLVVAVPVEKEQAIEVLRRDVLAEYERARVGEMLNPEMNRIRRAALDASIMDGTGARWLIFGHLFSEIADRFLPVYGLSMYLDEQGKPLRHAINYTARGPGMLEAYHAGVELGTDFLPFWFAVSLLHCRNVTVENAPIVPNKVRQKREKRGIPSVEYKTITVKPMRKTSAKSDVGRSREQVMQPMHFVRAHFRVYTADAPLFGKWAGTYWWDMYVRGSKGAGEIVKDFVVQAPVDQPQRGR